PQRTAQLGQRSKAMPRGREIEILRELLRNGARASHQAATLPIGLERLLDFDKIDAFMAPESRVLGHEHSALQMRRDAPVRYPLLDATRLAPLGARLAGAQIH